MKTENIRGRDDEAQVNSVKTIMRAGTAQREEVLFRIKD